MDEIRQNRGVDAQHSGIAPQLAAFVHTQSLRRSLVVYGTVAIAIIVALSPAVFFSFGYNNDFTAWTYDRSCCHPHPEMYFLIELGRYFAAFGETMQFWTVHTLADLRLWRLIGILSAAALAVYYLYIVSLRRPPTWQNAFLAIAVFTLPTVQFLAMWVEMYTMWAPPIFLSLVGAHLLLKATEHDVFVDRAAIGHCLRFTLMAFVSALAACFFYPMSAMCLVVPVAHLLLSGDDKRYRQMAVLAAGTLGGAVLALFIIHKFIVMPRLSDVTYLGDYAFVLSKHLMADALRRLEGYIVDSSYLWLGFQLPYFRQIVALLCFAGAIFAAVRLSRRLISPGRLVNSIAACFLFLVAAAPLLVVEHDTASYRVMLAMTGVELLLVFWLLSQLPVGSLRLAGIFAVLGVCSAFIGVYGVSASSGAEEAFLEKAVAGLSPQGFHSITVLQPSRSREVLGLPLDKEFGGLHPVEHIFDYLIGSRYDQKASFEVIMLELPSYADWKEERLQPAIDKNSIIIDMSPLNGEPPFADITKRLPTVTSRPPDTRRGFRWGPANAADGDPDSFWEVGDAQFPVEMEIDYPTAHTLLGYDLSTIEATERMPNQWEIWVTSDLLDWHRVQEMAEGTPWQTAEKRHYQLDPIPNVLGVKLVIKGTDDKKSLRLYEFQPYFSKRASANEK